MSAETVKHANALKNESSPYLLQHAHNPVNWYPWNREVLEQAKSEDKLLIISIGYSACHWCHVMERECFEDEETAAIMNRHFINIKVDREERPDVDQVYMHAVQLMTGRGGWPLNCIALPDGRPIYGGTYFPKAQWIQVLTSIADFYRNDRNKCHEYAGELTAAVQKPELFPGNKRNDFSRSSVETAYLNWKPGFDLKEGGPNRVPKFPLPNNFEFLLQYAWHEDHHECAGYVELTLDKMAYGGIYDQLGGGFARYATDAYWKVPHFEKMLYDNAQLVSLYANAWKVFKKPLYQDVVYETLSFIDREMTDTTGGFYSAIDADSEGVEGKYYIWKKEELSSLPVDQAALFSDYYNVGQKGLWEHDQYILLRGESDESFAFRNGISVDELKALIQHCRKLLLAEREKRIRPGLDDKMLVSWNSLMLKGYLDAYRAFNEPRFLEAAEKNMNFMISHCTKNDGGLYHAYKNGSAKINGYLEDYAAFIDASIAFYEVTFREEYLTRARQLADYCFRHFYDEAAGMFYFTSDDDDPLIARKMETTDNVIPASNSIMAKALFMLGSYFPESNFRKTASAMLAQMIEPFERYPSSYSNWGILLFGFVYPWYEVAVTGENRLSVAGALSREYIPSGVIASGTGQSTIPLLMNRTTAHKTLIWVCSDQQCRLPVEQVEDCLMLIEKK